MFEKRSHKVRLSLTVALLLTLSIVTYIKLGVVLQSNHSVSQVLNALLLAPSNSTLVNATNKTNNESQPLNSVPNEGFVTFSDDDGGYPHLLIPLLDSIHYFSTRPVIAFGVDFDLNLDAKKYPRLIQRRLNKSHCGRSIHFCKIHAIIESKLDYGVHVDADSIVNWSVDILFDVVHRWSEPFPLAPRHPTDAKNYDTFLQIFHVEKENRTMPYVHSQFSWNYRAYPFFEHLRELMRQGNFLGANYDESAVNTFLWKANRKHTLCKIDPYINYLTEYTKQKKTCKDFCHTAFIIIHGSKDKTEALDALKRLKRLRGAPFVQTPAHGFHFANESEFTCCYPDSKPSTIHPLICEYSQWIV